MPHLTEGEQEEGGTGIEKEGKKKSDGRARSQNSESGTGEHLQRMVEGGRFGGARVEK